MPTDSTRPAPSREKIINALYEAAEIEHCLMCTYLYAAFSLRSGVDEGLSGAEADSVASWRRTILGIAIDEMSHLIAVWNLTAALGGAPQFGRANFPIDPGYLPANLVVRLAPFDEAVIQHFIYLYYAPGACSLATRICLHEAGLATEFERVDLHAHLTESGDDYLSINPKGSVPLLVLDDGRSVTENVAILDLLAELEPKLGVHQPLGRTLLIEMLSFLSTELHIAFKPFFHSTSDADKATAAATVTRDLDLLGGRFGQGYLFGPRFTVADAYLFAMLRWALAFEIPLRSEITGFFERVVTRPAVRLALIEEGLPVPTLNGSSVADDMIAG